MIDHLSLGTRDLAAATRFYDACLSALGFVRLYASAAVSGYGPPDGDAGLDVFASVTGGHSVPSGNERPGGAPGPGPRFHVAFAAPSRASVDAFHAAALAAGGVDAGAPGPRPAYGAGYYAAYVLDLDGHRLEAVHHGER